MKYNTKNKKLNINDFQHPFDKRAVDAVTKVPGFEKLIEFISSNSIEKAYSLINDSSRMKVTKEMSPKIYEMMSDAAEIFDVDYIPEVYIERDYNMKVTLNGIKKPHIIFSSSFLEQISDEMLWNVIVSEYAGIEAKHGTIKFLDEVLKFIKGAIPFGVDVALDVAINDWYRNRAYTYDRAILLSSESFEMTAKHILFGEVSKDVLETLQLDKPDNTYLEQSREFFGRTGAEGLYQKFNTVFSRNQWMASRYMELYNWYNSGEYHDVLEGSVSK